MGRFRNYTSVLRFHSIIQTKKRSRGINKRDTFVCQSAESYGRLVDTTTGSCPLLSGVTVSMALVKRPPKAAMTCLDTRWLRDIVKRGRDTVDQLPLGKTGHPVIVVDGSSVHAASAAFAAGRRPDVTRCLRGPPSLLQGARDNKQGLPARRSESLVDKQRAPTTTGSQFDKASS